MHGVAFVTAILIALFCASSTAETSSFFYQATLKILLQATIEAYKGDLINAWKNMGSIQADLYKIAHHGAHRGGTNSKTYTNKDHFLQAVRPKYAFSSSAAPPNSYNHSNCGLYERLLMKNIVPIVERPRNPQAYYTCGRAGKKEQENMNRCHGKVGTP